MRLPLSKVYRAFPELDRFPDPDCRAYIRRAVPLQLRLHPTWRESWPAAIAVAIGALPCLLFRAIGEAVPRRWRGGDGESAVVLAAIATTVFAWALASLLYRDRRQRAAIGLLLRNDSCAGCGASLLGAPVNWGVASCPRCARQHDLLPSGLVAEDLLSRERAMDGRAVPTNASCPECMVILCGAIISNGSVTCAACRATTSVGRLGLRRRHFEIAAILGCLDGRAFPVPLPCPRCGYLLHGLPVVKGVIVCPECAGATTLVGLELSDKQFGVIEAFLAQRPHATSASPSDSP